MDDKFYWKLKGNGSKSNNDVYIWKHKYDR